MLRTFTCIMCPQGCEITAEGSEAPYSITGNKCKRGHEYVEQELVNPMRNIATSILVEGGEMPLASVRLSAPIPKAKIFDVMNEIRKVKRTAPIHEGEVVIENVLGLGSNVIVTRTVEAEKQKRKLCRKEPLLRLLLLSEGNRIFLRQIRVFGILFEII